jgi:hypothetical protein
LGVGRVTRGVDVMTGQYPSPDFLVMCLSLPGRLTSADYRIRSCSAPDQGRRVPACNIQGRIRLPVEHQSDSWGVGNRMTCCRASDPVNAGRMFRAAVIGDWDDESASVSYSLLARHAGFLSGREHPPSLGIVPASPSCGPPAAGPAPGVHCISGARLDENRSRPGWSAERCADHPCTGTDPVGDGISKVRSSPGWARASSGTPGPPAKSSSTQALRTNHDVSSPIAARSSPADRCPTVARSPSQHDSGGRMSRQERNATP